MSIRTRFILIIGLLSLLATGCYAYLSYSFTYSMALEEAKQKGNIVFSFLSSSRSFYRQKQRPIIMDIVHKDRFYPTIMSGFAMTRGLWDNFQQKFPDYLFKQATIDPLYPPNKADAQELKLINEFDHNKKLTQKEGIIEKSDGKFFFFAQPISVEKSCLRCHGDPKVAPKDIVELYGTEHGYGWQAGKTVSSYIIYVPIQKAIDSAKKSAMTLFAFGLVGIVIISLVIWFFVEKRIVSPIKMLEQRASEISVGKNLKEKIILMSKDEIGTLGLAIERMRVSVVKLMDRYTPK